MVQQAQGERPANPLRGEAELLINGRAHVLRPSYSGLIAAEEELGSLFALIERAGAGELRLAEMAALFWHCLPTDCRPERQDVGRAVTEMGLASAAKPLRAVLGQILQGSG